MTDLRVHKPMSRDEIHDRYRRWNQQQKEDYEYWLELARPHEKRKGEAATFACMKVETDWRKDVGRWKRSGAQS